MLPSPSTTSPSQFSYCKMKASPLRRSASLTLIRCNHVASETATSPVKATSPPVCLQRWRPTIPLSAIGLRSVVSVVSFPPLLCGQSASQFLGLKVLFSTSELPFRAFFMQYQAYIHYILWFYSLAQRLCLK